MKIYVVRHGQTEWNLDNRVCGITDIDLTNIGMEQARKLSDSLSARKIDIIISSPLKRAQQTARIISGAIEQDFYLDNRLIEQNFGGYEGVNRNNTDFLEAKRHFPNKMSGGESIMQVAQRVYNFLDEIRDKYCDKCILIITHGSVSRIINSYYTDQTNNDFYTFHLGNCELMEYTC